MSAPASNRSDDGADKGEEVNYEDDSGNEEQVSASDAGIQVSANTGIQASSEQVANGQGSPNRHIRFTGNAGKEPASTDANTAASSDTSSKGEGSSSPLPLVRMKKKPISSSINP